MAKTSAERYQLIWRLIKICSACCGANVTEPQYQMNVLTWFVNVAVNGFFVLTAYTVYVTSIKTGDWTAMLQNLCTAGAGLLGYTKLLTAIYHKNNLRYLFQEIYDIYAEYEKKHSEYRYCLEKSIGNISKAIKFMAITYLILASIIFLCPLYFYAFYDIKTLLLQYHVPGIDHTDTTGYFILFSLQFMHLALAVFGHFSVDTFFFNPICHMQLLKDILTLKFHDLNEMLMEEEAPIENEDINNTIKDIIRWHQKYMDFLSCIKKTFFWVLFVSLFTLVVNIVLAIFCIFLGKWPGAYAFLVYCFITLCIYCGLGTVVDVTNDAVIDSCYNEVLWYRLPLREQKMLRIMLMVAQNQRGIIAGGVVPLSVHTGVRVCKTIYTITMMLIQFTD